MMEREIPQRPWQMVACDLFNHSGKEYLVTADYYSDFFEVDLLNASTSATVIDKLRGHFARHGIPETVVSDNGPQFSSKEFDQFSTAWDFVHRKTSPYHSQSNGKAESAVKEVKKLMQKAKDAGEDPYLYLLEKRNTPTSEMKLSPVQRLFGRRTRTLLPITARSLKPTTFKTAEIRENLLKRMENQKRYFDHRSKPLDVLQAGDSVWIQPTEGERRWTKGTVLNRYGPRSYEISTNKTVLRRNRCHLRKAKSNIRDNVEHPAINTSQARLTRSGLCYQTEMSQTEKKKDVMKRIQNNAKLGFSLVKHEMEPSASDWSSRRKYQRYYDARLTPVLVGQPERDTTTADWPTQRLAEAL